MIEARGLTKRYVDSVAGGAGRPHRTDGDERTLSPWAGLTVTIGWVIVLTVVAATRLRRRDA